MNNLQLINTYFEKGFLLDKKLLEKLTDEMSEISLQSEISKKSLSTKNRPTLGEKKLPAESHLSNISGSLEINLNKNKIQDEELILTEKLIISLETQKESETKKPLTITDNKPNEISSKKYPLSVSLSYENKTKKYEVKDFTNIFISRYKYMEKILKNRQEMNNILSINRLLNKKERETVSLIGIVSEIITIKTGNLIIVLEDLTGRVNLRINKDKKETYNLAKEIVLDEVIGVVGVNQGNNVFVEKIIWPEIPLTKPLKKYNEEIYAIFLSDIHVGSTNFLSEEFNKFLSWIRGETGNQKQKEIAQKIKYIFIAGDLVDGVGIYPGQDKELTIKDINQQYQEAANLLKKIPPQIQIIICPGNHDALPLAEPQPVFNSTYIKPLLELPNVVLVSNPSLINICQTENFSGFDILMYHGYSFDYYVANIDYIRSNGGYERADLIMKLLLKKRHLAPSFGSAPYFPSKEDNLIIRNIPDFFITGHIHYSVAANYRNITMICGSCWQSKTSFQEKVGHEPQPARVPIINLKTREIKILKFM